MKKFRKIMAVVAAMAMTVAMSFGALAEGETTTPKTHKITISQKQGSNDNATHTYAAYQIFSGDYSTESGTDKLSNIKWGSGVDQEKIAADAADIKTALGIKDGEELDVKDAAKVADKLTESNAAAFAKVIAEDLSSTKKDSTEGTTTIEGVEDGYYLIEDSAAPTGEGKNGAMTSYILSLVPVTGENVSVTAKEDVPSDTKTVQDEKADAEDVFDDGYGASADHDINETFNFKLTATIPADSHLADYKTYPITFHDTMSTGITFENIVSVKVNGTTITNYSLSDNAVNGLAGKATWTLTTPDLKTVKGVKLGTDAISVEVIYAAHLNEDAYVNTESGSTTNKNTSHITYNNNPNGEGTGTTPDKEVYVFTFGINNTKYKDKAEQGNELAGAEFTLYKADGTTEYPLIYDDEKKAYRPVKGKENSTVMTSGADGKFNVIGLDAGTYVLKETKTPVGYNTAADVTVVISATHKNNNVTLTSDCKNMTNNIIDTSGSQLPTTGGMGTTILYVAGAILVIAGAAVLVIKKRHEA